MELLSLGLAILSAVIAAFRFGLARKNKKPYMALSVTATLCLMLPAFWLVRPGHHGHDHTRAKSTACLSNMKQLALGQIMYANDNNDRLARTAPLWAAQAYLKPSNRDPRCPSDPLLRYGVNAACLGIPPASIKEPESTLLISETRRRDEIIEANSDLAYPHPGKTIVALASGSGRMISTPRPVYWSEGKPVALNPVGPASTPFVRLKKLFDSIAPFLFLGAWPVSLVMTFLQPKNSPRRQFWRYVSLGWTLWFLCAIMLPTLS